MAETNELKKIKKKYGENFMKLCRELFPTILEKEGRLYEILTSTFSDNCKTLYEDLTKENLQYGFKDFIYSKVDVETPEIKIKEEKTPYELLEEAGYDLYECKTNEEIQKFKKYYASGEELCTFSDANRLDREVVFFAVKKDAEKIKREDFENPKREDEYGTSVMGIQFSKNGICTVSIKNRYNHRVNNPDSTYGNDLNRIVPGLTESFGKLLKQRGLKLNSSNIERFEIPGYTVANDGKYYKYNMEIGANYYCPGNVIIKAGEVQKIENPERKMLIDYFILDLEKKTLEVSDKRIGDSFPDAFEDIEKIEIRKEKGKGTRIITIQKKDQEEPIIIEIDRNNQIIGYRNKELKEVGDDFLFYNESLTELDLPKLEVAGYYFLFNNEVLERLEVPNLRQAGFRFLHSNKALTELEAPNLETVRDDFLCRNKGLRELNLPKLEEVGDDFLFYNESLTELDLPKLEEVGDDFLRNNEVLEKLKVPKLEEVGDDFLFYNKALKELEAPNCPELIKRFSIIINGNLIKQSEKDKPKINSADIANLDKKNEITISETSFAKRIIDRLKTLFKGNKDQR